MRPSEYACVAYVRRFRPIEGLHIPAVFGSVLVRVLHTLALDISAGMHLRSFGYRLY